MIFVATLPLTGHESRLAEIPDLRDIIFLASHGKDPHGLLLLLLGIYAGVLGYGLWRLKRWSRNSLMGTSGIMIAFCAAHYYLGTTATADPKYQLGGATDGLPAAVD